MNEMLMYNVKAFNYPVVSRSMNSQPILSVDILRFVMGVSV